jgi:hypothetical protein
MRYFLLGLGLGVALGFVWRALLGNEDTLDTWEAAAPPGASTTGAPDVAPPPPAKPVPPAAADVADRESESRLDDESEYERSREDEERERAEAALRLQANPFAWRREAGPAAER